MHVLKFRLEGCRLEIRPGFNAIEKEKNASVTFHGEKCR